MKQQINYYESKKKQKHPIPSELNSVLESKRMKLLFFMSTWLWVIIFNAFMFDVDYLTEASHYHLNILDSILGKTLPSLDDILQLLKPYVVFLLVSVPLFGFYIACACFSTDWNIDYVPCLKFSLVVCLVGIVCPGMFGLMADIAVIGLFLAFLFWILQVKRKNDQIGFFVLKISCIFLFSVIVLLLLLVLFYISVYLTERLIGEEFKFISNIIDEIPGEIKRFLVVLDNQLLIDIYPNDFLFRNFLADGNLIGFRQILFRSCFVLFIPLCVVTCLSGAFVYFSLVLDGTLENTEFTKKMYRLTSVLGSVSLLAFFVSYVLLFITGALVMVDPVIVDAISLFVVLFITFLPIFVILETFLIQLAVGKRPKSQWNDRRAEDTATDDIEE